MAIIDLIFFFSVLFLIFRIKTELFNLLKDSFSRVFFRSDLRHHHEAADTADLPIIRFQDLQDRRRHTAVEEMCFVCSVNYDGDDVVSQLSRCGHVFHTECVGKLIHRKQPNCPFCRSSFFSGRPSPACKNIS
ncbi:hypothetical protein OSB04_026755 [Centaurea solstitialis]|uniref:RING-type domain-containing protein n=1 Tax=Centaurea solstitialis TaxID=347529 RepID=A0AA38SDV3_9ASTR|nr:hypothetical protein OSB04_026755 [Centaurea solstitialis]